MTRFVLPLLLLLSACGDDRPAAPTREESARLDEADAMLDDLTANEEGPADRSASPSNSSE
ncbi:MAG: hypothetical protein M3Q83_02440 [Pseudomonadota bacterium]|nr:hypothetical protein [Pseudomonadota bacterium]